MEPRRSKCQKNLDILHPKILYLGFETIVKINGKIRNKTNDSIQTMERTWERFEFFPTVSIDNSLLVGSRFPIKRG